MNINRLTKLSLAALAAVMLTAGCAKAKKMNITDLYSSSKATAHISASTKSLEGKIKEKVYKYSDSVVSVKGPSSLLPGKEAEYTVTVWSEKGLSDVVIWAQASSASASSNTGIYFYLNKTLQQRVEGNYWTRSELQLNQPMGKRVLGSIIPLLGKGALKSSGIPGLSSGVGPLRESLIPDSYVGEVNEDMENLFTSRLCFASRPGKGFRALFYLKPMPNYNEKDVIKFGARYDVNGAEHIFKMGNYAKEISK